MTVLEADGVVCGYGPQDEILKGVAMTVRAGEIVVIIGPNGAGKSTFLKTVAGLIRPRPGSIRFEGVEIAGERPRDVARRGVAFVPQEANVFPTMDIRENLEVSGWLDRAAWRARAAENERRFPVLARRRRATAAGLSGGQRQSLAMAMGLMVRPTLLLLDEPSAGLSPKATDELFKSIDALRDEGKTVLMVEQKAAEALRIADRAYLLVDGRNARDGAAAQLSSDPEIRRLFLGA